MGYDDGETLLQKRDFATSLCLAGTFAWAVDLGGPGTLSDLANMDPEAGMDGMDPGGLDSGSGNVYIGQEIYTKDWPTISCIPPCNFIFPPLTLSTATTISFEPYTTSLEVVWPTTTVVTEDGTASTSTGFSRTIYTTVITLPPVTTTAIDAWNWNITSTSPVNPVYRLSSSILPPPIQITNPTNSDIRYPPGQTPTPVTRSITPPPYPWSTNTEDPNPFPTVSLTRGPPGPLCTAGCGRQCHLFCSGACALDCTDGGSDFFDPQDPDPPGKTGCRGPDCHNGECTGDLCMYAGCEGDDCDSGICAGDDCHPVGCSGDDCGTDGHCSGGSCITAGCTGSACNGSGFCFGLSCFSFGCWGLGCGSDHTCSSSECKLVTCTGRNCEYGVCTGDGCTPGAGEDGCEGDETADRCTVVIGPSTLTVGDAVSTTTTTSTDCETVTVCGAADTTATTTRDPDGTTITQTEGYYFATATGTQVWNSIADTINSRLSKYGAFGPTTTTTTRKTTTSTTSKTTTHAPTPTEAAGCSSGYDNNGQGLCWSPCDIDSGLPIDSDWQKGEPWCWLLDIDNDMGAFCDHVDDCPTNFECQPDDDPDGLYPDGGCRVPDGDLPASSGCSLMTDVQAGCWAKCDPETSEIVDSPWTEGDPWCWLWWVEDDMGALCTDEGDCKGEMICQPDDKLYGGCSTNPPHNLSR